MRSATWSPTSRAASTSSWGQRHGTRILTRLDLFDAGEIRSVRDLRGRRVAVAGGEGSAGHYLFLLGARRGGIGARDFTLVNLPNPNHGAALSQGRVDASLTGRRTLRPAGRTVRFAADRRRSFASK
jgi:ABC-type nitrate/sulfonate/bicarbonate transport system substrate-binding protein